jgi:hypothetical protein
MLTYIWFTSSFVIKVFVGYNFQNLLLNNFSVSCWSKHFHHLIIFKHTSWKVPKIAKNYKFYDVIKGVHNPNNPVIIFHLSPLAPQSITVMEIDLLRWGTLLNIIMIIAEIAFSLECHILLDMINICEEKNLFEIIWDFHGWIEGFLIKIIKTIQSHRNTNNDYPVQ